MSIFWCRVHSYVHLLSTQYYLGAPFRAFWTYAKKPSFISFCSISLILLINTCSYITKVLNMVITWIPVYVIYQPIRPFAI